MVVNKESLYKNYDPEGKITKEDNLESYWFVFSENRLLITEDKENNFIPYIENPDVINLEIKNTYYLGTLFDKPCYCGKVSKNCEAPDEMSFKDLRPLFNILDENIYHLAGKALQIITWDQNHQFCSRCGTKTKELKGETAKICPKCNYRSYPRISPAVITAIFKDDKILLAHNHNFRDNMYSLIAGFAEAGETLEECVQRETMEEVGIKVKNIRYFGSQSWPFPHSMMVGFTAEYDSGEINVDGVEIEHAEWFTKDNLPVIPSQVSIARKIIDWYIDKK